MGGLTETNLIIYSFNLSNGTYDDYHPQEKCHILVNSIRDHCIKNIVCALLVDQQCFYISSTQHAVNMYQTSINSKTQNRTFSADMRLPLTATHLVN